MASERLNRVVQIRPLLDLSAGPATQPWLWRGCPFIRRLVLKSRQEHTARPGRARSTTDLSNYSRRRSFGSSLPQPALSSPRDRFFSQVIDPEGAIYDLAMQGISAQLLS